MEAVLTEVQFINPNPHQRKGQTKAVLCHQSVKLSLDKPISGILIIHETQSENKSEYILEHLLSWSVAIPPSVERLLNSICHLFVPSTPKGPKGHKWLVWWWHLDRVQQCGMNNVGDWWIACPGLLDYRAGTHIWGKWTSLDLWILARVILKPGLGQIFGFR